MRNINYSKTEGGKWGKTYLSDEYTDFIQNVLDCYASDKEFVIDTHNGQQFARYMKRNIFDERAKLYRV